MSDTKRTGSAEKKGDDGETATTQAAEAVPLDPRVEWFSERTLNSLRLKQEKWKKMTAVKDNL